MALGHHRKCLICDFDASTVVFGSKYSKPTNWAPLVCEKGLAIWGMSFKERSMAAQGAADIAVIIAPPLAPHNQQGQASPPSFAHSNSFVRAIDRKARSCLKALERSMSFSTIESRDEDPSSMTIEFLKMRLQAQRAEYKAEKERAQQLAKKVMELEQRLNREIGRRKKAEHHDMLLSRRNGKFRSFHSYNDRTEYAKFRETSSGEEHSDCCSEISGSEDSIFLISPSSLQHPLRVQSREHQQKTNQHELQIKAMESRMLDDEEPREKTYVGSKTELYEPNGSEDSYHTETCCTTDGLNPQPSKIENTYDNSSSEHEEPVVADQFVLQNQSCVHPCTLYEMDSMSESEGPEYINATKEMKPLSNNYHVKPMFSCQNCQQNHIHPADGTIYEHLPPQNGVYVLDFQTPLEAEKTSDFGATVEPGSSKSSSIEKNHSNKYIFAHSRTNKDEPEEGYILEQVMGGEYIKALLPLDIIKTLEDYEISLIGLSSEKLHSPCKKGSPNHNLFSPLQTSQRGRLHGCQMSLDGGIDSLQEIRQKDRQSSSRQSIS